MPAMRADVSLHRGHFINKLKETLLVEGDLTLVSWLFLNEPEIHGDHALPWIPDSGDHRQLLEITGVKMLSVRAQGCVLVIGEGPLNPAFEQGGIFMKTLFISEH